MRVLDHLVLYRDRRFFCAFPSAVGTADGGVLVVFRRARDQRSLFAVSADEYDPRWETMDHLDCRSHLCGLFLAADLKASEEPFILPPDPEAGDQDASLLRLQDGRLLLGGFSWYPYQGSYDPNEQGERYAAERQQDPLQYRFWGSYIRLGSADGREWTAHRYLPAVPNSNDIVPGSRPFHGGSLRGRPLERSDGTLLVATYGWGRKGALANDSHLFVSQDAGESWTYGGMIAEATEAKKSLVEPSLYETPRGELVALHRTIGMDDCLVTARSPDGGQTWQAWQRQAVKGHPYDLCVLPSGQVLLVYGYRHEPMGIRARLVDPELREFDYGPEFVLRDDGRCRDIGYPWIVPLNGAEILVVYYNCDPNGLRYIAGTVLQLD